MKRDTLLICSVLILCTASILCYLHYPTWKLERDNEAVRELSIASREGMPALEAWVADHQEHRHRPKVQTVLLMYGKHPDAISREIDRLIKGEW